MMTNLAGRTQYVVAATLLCVFLAACSPISKTKLAKRIVSTEEQYQDHVGFMLYDLAARELIYEHNSERYFTPASNTKIFTLYASLNLLGDSIPAFRYTMRDDSLIVWGTGDPSFLYKNVYDNGRAYRFLKSNDRSIYLSFENFYTTRFGPGWSWEDYDFSYSSERSIFPIYGNIFDVVVQSGQVRTKPSFFERFMIVSTDTLDKPKVSRSSISNATVYFPGDDKHDGEWTKPFMTDSALVAALLSDTLKKKVTPVWIERDPTSRVFKSIPVDSVYKVMMQDSDNFLAEQLLLLCAESLGDSIMPEKVIRHVKKSFLHDLPDEPIWVDGSGLSRYNLFTPRSIVKLWEKIHSLVPQERLFAMLATGGVNGTVKSSYRADIPYVFGKTGTLSNVHCLSGYLVTKSKKTLIFSFMNTNFTAPTRVIRNRMEEILVYIRDNYK